MTADGSLRGAARADIVYAAAAPATRDTPAGPGQQLVESAPDNDGLRQPGTRAHVLTVSLEEYFHSDALARVVLEKHWNRFESRIDRSVDEALALLGRHGARATFFVLGVLAERNPRLVARIAAAGHEVASRGYWPRAVAGLSRDSFAADLDRAAQAIAAAGGGRPRGYRAPRWIGPSELWILEVLAAAGYAYDASVDPSGWRFRRRRDLHTVGRVAAAGGIVEVPASTTSVAGYRVGIGGGAWMRQLPHAALSRAVARWDRRRAAPLVFHLTSWELDPDQPQITAASRLSTLRQYRNLWRTRWCFERYLERYRFTSVADHLGLPAAAQAAATPDAGPVTAGRAAVAAPGPERSAAQRTAVSVVVPVFNERDNIGYFLRTMAMVAERSADRYQLELVFVDDCSTDDTWDVLQQRCAGRADIKLVRHERNRGVSAAILTGAAAAGHDVVCSLDCDCSYDPMDLQQMVPLLDGADLVTASPYHPGGQVANVPAWRLGLSRGLSWIYRKLLRRELYTWTSCFRVYRREALAGIELDHGGFLGTAELLVRVLRRGGVVREFPTLLESRLLGVSKMRTLRTILGHLGLLWQVGRGRVR